MANLFSAKQFKFFTDAILRHEDFSPDQAFIIRVFLAQEFKNNCPNFDMRKWNKALAEKLS